METGAADEDCGLYVDLLRANAARYRLQIRAYCLIPNHVHFIAVPERPAALAKTSTALGCRVRVDLEAA